MKHRYYICPIVGTGTDTDLIRAKIIDHRPKNTSAAIGGKTWALVRVDTDDYTAIDADADCIDVLEKITDIAGITKSEIVTWLKARTVADVPAAMRNRINNRLTAIGVSATGITLSTPLWEVLVRVFRAIEPINRLEDM